MDGLNPAEAGGGKSYVKWVNFLACMMVFSDGIQLGRSAFGDIRSQYLIMLPLMGLLIFSLGGFYMSLSFTVGLVALGVASFWNVLEGRDTYILLFKQIVVIYLNASIFYMVLKMNDWDVRPLFRMYLAFCVPTAAFGIVQEAAYLLRLKPIYDLSWIIPGYTPSIGEDTFLRINSIVSEPASLSLLLIPAFFLALVSLFGKGEAALSRRNSLIIIGAMVLTQSSIGYMGAGLVFLLWLINLGKFRHVFTFLAVIPALGALIYFNSIEVRTRVDDSAAFLFKGDELEELNLSTFAIFSNMQVATTSFRENPILGSGLGSHLVSYGRFIGNFVDFGKTKLLLNEEDANSLFLRLMSETGLLGLAMFFWFLFRFRLPKARDGTGILWVINNGIFVYMVLRLIRFGHYFELGFFAFFWLYYFSYRFALDSGESTAPEALRPA